MPNKDIFKVGELPLDELASSLGLAATPSTRFLKALKSKNRDALRGAKNVDQRLKILKGKIKAEKLAKRLAKLGKTSESNKDDDHDASLREITRMTMTEFLS